MVLFKFVKYMIDIYKTLDRLGSQGSTVGRLKSTLLLIRTCVVVAFSFRALGAAYRRLYSSYHNVVAVMSIPKKNIPSKDLFAK